MEGESLVVKVLAAGYPPGLEQKASPIFVAACSPAPQFHMWAEFQRFVLWALSGWDPSIQSLHSYPWPCLGCPSLSWASADLRPPGNSGCFTASWGCGLGTWGVLFCLGACIFGLAFVVAQRTCSTRHHCSICETFYLQDLSVHETVSSVLGPDANSKYAVCKLPSESLTVIQHMS